MTYRALLILLLATFSCACNSESKSENTKSADSSFENKLMAFSEAISNRDTAKLIAITHPEGIYLVRKFTSGNLGGRGKEFSDKIQMSSINHQMELPIKEQTPFSFKILFPELPIKSYEKLPQYKLPAEINTLSFDQWAPLLAKALNNRAETINGEPIILVSDSHYWVYAETQLIDGILVGGFAVFKSDSDNLLLVSVIEFL